MTRTEKRKDRSADGRQRKRATRRMLSQQIQEEQDRQKALGLARVYLGGEGSEAMQRNVRKHIEAMAAELGERDGIGPLEALDQVEQRLAEVLREAGS